MTVLCGDGGRLTSVFGYFRPAVVEVVAASMEGEGLGITAEDRARIEADATHLIHTAASVRCNA